MKDKLKFDFWGVRGTAPVAKRNGMQYGGNTICTQVISNSPHPVIIDAGTGIINLGRTLLQELNPKGLRIHLMLTHFHLDHLMGLPYFAPLYHPGIFIDFYSPLSQEETIDYLSALMRGRFFPVDFLDTGSHKTFHQVGEEVFEVDSLTVSSLPLRHPQGCLGYRFKSGDRVLISATDAEYSQDDLGEELPRFCRDADILLFDAMYSPDDYPDKTGWGHSTWETAVALAKAAGVKELYLGHLNPYYSDKELDFLLNRARLEFPVVFFPDEKIAGESYS